MAKPVLPDALWAKVEPLLPRPKRRRFRSPGRKPLTRRQALTGILFVLRTGIRWNDLPCEMGCGSGSRCRRYLKAWHEAGVWDRLHALLLAELDGAGKISTGPGRRWTPRSSGLWAAGRGPARARWTGGRRGPSTTPWWTRTVSRSGRRPRRPTSPT